MRYSTSGGKFVLTVSITFRTEAAAASALVPGRWKAPMPTAGVSLRNEFVV